MRKEQVPSWEHNVRRLRDSDTTLTELSLTYTSIGEDRWRELGEALSDNSTLTNLDLGYCGITAAGAAHLAEGVGKSASLATLDLLGNNLRDSGAQALGAALAATSTLTSLNLENCGITAAGAAHLAEGVRQGPPRRVPLTLHGVDLGRVAAQVGLGDTADGWDTDKVLAALNVKCAAARPSGAGTGGLGPGARGGVGEGAAAEAAGAGGGGGEGGGGEGGSAEGREAALRRELEVVKRGRDATIRELRCKEEATRRELEVVKRERDSAIRHKEEALRELRSREEATRRAEAAVGARDEAIRSKDAEIARLRRLAYGVEVLDVDAGVTRVVEEAGAGAEPPLKRMRLEQAAGARVVGALQERLVAVKKEQVEERATRHSELRASVDAKVKAAVKEALEQVADALECACCFEPLAPGTAVALECGHTYCNRQACASSSVTACPECRQPIGARVPLFGVLANVCGLLPRDA